MTVIGTRPAFLIPMLFPMTLPNSFLVREPPTRSMPVANSFYLKVSLISPLCHLMASLFSSMMVSGV